MWISWPTSVGCDRRKISPRRGDPQVLSGLHQVACSFLGDHSVQDSRLEDLPGDQQGDTG